MVKWFRGRGAASSAKMAAIMAGVNSLEERPYRPPTTRGGAGNGAVPAAIASLTAATTSRYSGSPALPGSLVRSSTAMALTVGGSAATKRSTANGRYSRTFTTPTFSPRPARASTVSSAASAPEPMRTITRSASGAPT